VVKGREFQHLVDDCFFDTVCGGKKQEGGGGNLLHLVFITKPGLI